MADKKKRQSETVKQLRNKKGLIYEKWKKYLELSKGLKKW